MLQRSGFSKELLPPIPLSERGSVSDYIRKQCWLLNIDPIEYRNISEITFGCAPHDVEWAIGTSVYKSNKK